MANSTRRLQSIVSKIIWSIIPTIILLSVGGYFGLAINRQVYPPLVPVEGTSMNPLLKFGDLAMLKKVNFGNLRKGDVIAFRTSKDVQQKWNVPGSYVHRIVTVEKGTFGQQFQTQGDNVAGKDPFWTVEQNVIGIYAGKISRGGYPILFFRSRQGQILAGGALLIFFIYWVMGVFERRRAADAVNVRNLASVVDEARRITNILEVELSAKSTALAGATLRPKDWIIDGDFLTGRLSPQAPEEIVLAQKIAIALESALANSSWPSYDVATRAQVPIPVMNGIIEGELIPDLATLAQLGKVLSYPFLTL